MLIHRPAAARGRTLTDWLESRHAFSFGDYYAPEWMGFGALRVLNEDRVAAHAGFAEHAHANMEILTWVIEGALAHRDSTGTQGLVRAGELQRMSAGHGIRHSEMNASDRQPVHFLQIWIQPERSNRAPSYAQRGYADAHLEHGWALLAAPAASSHAEVLPLHAAARVWAWRPAGGYRARFPLHVPRAWLQVTRGALEVEGITLAAGDGLGIEDEAAFETAASHDSEVLLFELLA